MAETREQNIRNFFISIKSKRERKVGHCGVCKGVWNCFPTVEGDEFLRLPDLHFDEKKYGPTPPGRGHIVHKPMRDCSALNYFLEHRSSSVEERVAHIDEPPKGFKIPNIEE